MDTLILTVGLPRSGKSTWCRTQVGKCPVVNPDSIRFALYGTDFIPESEEVVWTTAHLMVKALFLAGHNIVIVDSTNLTEWQREDWAKRICAKIEYKVFNADMATCIERARSGGREDLIPIIERMNETLDPDELDELDGLTLSVSTEIILEDGINEDRVVKIIYKDLHSNKTIRYIEPIEIYKKPDLFVRAFCRFRNEEREFCIDRIIEASLTDVRF